MICGKVTGGADSSLRDIVENCLKARSPSLPQCREMLGGRLGSVGTYSGQRYEVTFQDFDADLWDELQL